MGSPRPRAGVRRRKRRKRRVVKGGGLDKWFKERWVDLGRPKEGGGFEPCGREDAESGKYPKCVPAAEAARMSARERASAVRRKRRAESETNREDGKPVNVDTYVEKARNVPSDPRLYSRVKSEAKRKFDVYPSAYANGWIVQEYKRRGGTYRVVKASFGGDRSAAGRYAAQQRWKNQAKGDSKKKADANSDSPRVKSFREWHDSMKESVDKAWSEKNMKLSAEFLQGKGAGDGTISERDRKAFKDTRARLDTVMATEAKAVTDALKALDKGVDVEGNRKALKSSVSRLRREAKKLRAEQEKMGLKPTGVTDNTLAGMAYFSAAMTLDRFADYVKLEMDRTMEKASTPAWQRKEGQNPKGGLNAKGRASYARETGGKLKAPVKRGDNPRRASFLARMGNAKGPERNPDGSPTRLLLSLQAWGANSKAEARKKAKAISARNKAKKKT